MQFKYDYYNRVDPPKLTLCNPGATYTFGQPLTRVVGYLKGTQDEEIVYSFNDVSSLNFRANKTLAVADSEFCYSVNDTEVCIAPLLEVNTSEALYAHIQNRRLIFVDDVGFFVITDVNESCDENGLYYKDVQAESAEVELRNKTIPYFANGTYPLIDTEVGAQSQGGIGTSNTVVDGVLSIIVGRFPLWSIGHVDNAVKSRWRTFEDVDISDNCLSFIRERIQKAYDCIVEFDNLNRVINVYDRITYPDSRHTDIFISTDDLIKSIQLHDNIESSCTALRVTGDNNLSIASVNPLGGSTIYDFSYYSSWFSTGLNSAYNRWVEAINLAQPTYMSQCLDRDIYTVDAVQCSAEVDRLNVIIKVFQQLLDNINASIDPTAPPSPPGLTDELFDEVNDYIKQINDSAEAPNPPLDPVDPSTDINAAIASIESIIDSYELSLQLYQYRLNLDNQTIASLTASITATINSLALDVFFSQDQYDELKHYIFEADYNDEYIAINETMSLQDQQVQRKALYDSGKEELSHRVKPEVEFSITLNDLLMTQHVPFVQGVTTVDENYDHITSQLNLGALISVELAPPTQSLFNGSYYTELVVVGIVVNYSDYTMSITVGSRYDPANPKALFAEIFER